MRHTLLTVLLTLGVVLGLLSGFHSLHHARSHRAEFERHVADVCVAAAARVSGHPPHAHGP